jgi:phosphoribosylanthranilate isomerase
MPLDIKICGLKTPEALSAALAHGASHLGFIFFPRSPRNILPDDAGRLRTLVPNGAVNGRRVKTVAVTVDADDGFLDSIVAEMFPDMLQLHGKETPERVAEVKARFDLPVIKALPVAEAYDLDAAKAYHGIADRMLFDAKPPRGAQLPGGNGVSYDWSLLSALPAGTDYFLSGGLTADNVGEALRQADPPGIDVSSGIESAPGAKDVGLIAAFFEAVRAAERPRGVR